MGNSQTKAKNKYNKANYDTLLLSMPKGTKDQLKDCANKLSVSVNKLLNDYIQELINKDINITVEQKKIDDKLHQEAKTIKENLKTMQQAVEAKPKKKPKEKPIVWFKHVNTTFPTPSQEMYDQWIEWRKKGHSYTEIQGMTQEKTGHSFELEWVGKRIHAYIDTQVSLGDSEMEKLK